MNKHRVIQASAFLLFVFFLVPFVCLAQEQITITTYYPAPFGIYREVRADQLAVGTAYRASALSDGMLIVADRVGIGTATPVAAATARLDVNGNINVQGTQVRMANSATHYYGDATNLAARVAGDFYVQTQNGAAYRNIYAGDVYLGAPTNGTPARWASTGGCQRMIYANGVTRRCAAGTSVAVSNVVTELTDGIFLCCSYY